ncbi:MULTISPECIES: hypothetical protein [Okeania]|uniref:Uncharacterized protein n=1 Tax=Okeania hirsuta TaxID=1458930 RepID=A0A3N6R193_9CYAN|nr:MULTISPECIES: hypothetical protein [Okeania]NEP07969.1 hypothetical protein [Okeania sp. SIO4D6]NEP38393.1 hypothetical protein [Okeania sp. SIO2H7]NET12891.1 hypothetical protein [Okeania sp. SIO1H6]NEP72803.1 hypothetical protein [Okeania sp. SIO2G5]NEP97165.1 hypothetical protein [Okeania sp. SIO2F5]
MTNYSGITSNIKEIDITKTLQYLASGLVEWEKLDLDKRNELSKALPIGISKILAISIFRIKFSEILSIFLVWIEYFEKP